MKFLISSFNTTKLFLEQEERNMYIQSDVDKCMNFHCQTFVWNNNNNNTHISIWP